MCGICGCIEPDGAPADAPCVERMTALLAHRGPDGRGVKVGGPCALGHRRLSIIDVAGSPQPMADASSGSFLSYNGEIYNYRELRDELVGRGERFETQGDTEVLLKILVRDGPQGLARVNGIFAFGFWDAPRRRLVVGRDRLGVKPLYYWTDGRQLAFASEIKALLQVPRFRATLNEPALASYLVYANVHGPETLFSGVKRLPPGSWGETGGNGLTIHAYWSLPEPDFEQTWSVPRANATAKSLIEDAVRMQMVSDVPVGSLCSGGLDSALISALCVANAGHQFNTFNATFPQGPPFDESSYAKEVAAHIGSRHHEVVVGPAAVARGLEPLIWFNDEPIHHSSSIAIYYVAKRARNDVKVLLSGEGSDELFAGYPRYGLLRLNLLARNKVLRMGLGAAASMIPNRRRRDKLVEQLAFTPREAVIFNVTTVRRDELRRVLRPEWRQAIDDAGFAFENALLGDGRRDFEGMFRRMLRFDQGTFLATSCDRLDKMTMAASLEGRVPFLDHRLVEAASHMSHDALVVRGEGKQPVRLAAKDRLPDRIINRKKWGFGLPIASILTDDALRDHVNGMWQRGGAVAGIYDMDALRATWEQLLAGRSDLGEIVWRALNLDIWSRMFLGEELPHRNAPEERDEEHGVTGRITVPAAQ
jgi:asparagine synthase (glutamine-hydrolysing)